jgi:hypothetical protein
MLSSSALDPFPTSPLRHPSHAHALTQSLAPSKVSRIVASFGGAHATDGEAWIERKSRLCSGSRLIYSAEQPQGSGQRKMGERIIAQAGTREIRGLPIPTNYSTQHGRNMAIPVSFAQARRLMGEALRPVMLQSIFEKSGTQTQLTRN